MVNVGPCRRISLMRDNPLQRFQGTDLDFKLIQTEQRPTGGIRHIQGVQGDRSGGAKGLGTVLETFIEQAELDIQQARLDSEIGVRGNVGHVSREIDTAQVEAEFGFPGAGKGFDLSLQIEGGPVDGCGKMGLHENIGLGRQAREERHGDIDVGNVVGFPPDVVLKMDFTLGELNVVERKTERFAGGSVASSSVPGSGKRSEKFQR